MSDSVFVPLEAATPLVICPLLHSIIQENGSPSGSLIGIPQVKLNWFVVEPFVGDGVPNTSGKSSAPGIGVKPILRLIIIGGTQTTLLFAE